MSQPMRIATKFLRLREAVAWGHEIGLANVLAGWLGQMADVLHCDGDEDTDCCQEEERLSELSAGPGSWPRRSRVMNLLAYQLTEFSE